MPAERRRWAEEESLDPDVVQRLFEDLIRYFISREMDHLDDDPEKSDPPLLGNDSR